ncbi:MAG: T9SS type A sorting domain-containing protein [Bacteroidia bacterium]|nr:T9SS type A sorting domain-containing protein [Bacteroidia bacterium]
MRILFLGFLLLLNFFQVPFASAQHDHNADEGIAVRLPEESFLLTSSHVQERQSLSKAHSAFSSFIRSNADWSFDYDALRRTPHRASGSGIPIEGFQNISLLNAPQAGRAFIRQHAGELNVNPTNLRLLYSEILDGKAYQKYIQTYNGIDVLFSYVDLRISSTGRVFMFGSDYHPALAVNTTPAVSEAAAREFAKAGLPYVDTHEHITDRGLVILPVRYSDRYEYRLVYNFEVHSGVKERWDTYVDAHDGTIVWRKNLIPHFACSGHEGPNGVTNVVNGRIMINIFQESYVEAPVTVPLKNAYVWVAGKMYTTDSDGRFTVDLGAATTGQLITKFTGPYANVRRADTTRVSGGTPVNAVQSMTVAAGQNLEIVWDNTNSVASERNTFYHINLARDFSRALDAGPANNTLDTQIPGIVEINSECNAFFDGRGVNFFKSSLSCGNTGEISSVIHHELGHGIHIWLTQKLIGRAPVNGALKEAIADLTTNLLRDDPRIGVGFLKNGAGGGIIRNSDNTLRYPENVVNEIHDDGMILTGAVWDVRRAIGLEQTAKLYHMAMYGTPDGASLGVALADYFIEFLVADDDDGNLANGTPHSEAIIAAFNAHGIPGSAISITHTPLGDQNSVTTPYGISGRARVSNEINQEMMSVTQVDVVYSVDDWKNTLRFTTAYDAASKNFTGEFPPQPAGTIVRYYLEAFDNFGTSAKEPMNAPQSNYLFLVGFEQKYFHDGETADGWSVRGDAGTGEWVREDPVGTWNTSLGTPPDVPYVQPNEDNTPGTGKTKCWVTGNAARGAGLGTNDVDDGETTIFTRNYDISGMSNPVLRYFRWYSNNAGAEPNSDFWTVRISSTSGNWGILERTKVSDASWQPKVFILKEHVSFTPDLVVQFTAEDAEPGSLVEAAVDDFEILDVNPALVSVENEHALPTGLALSQNYPNPFNPSTVIRYQLPTASMVELRVFNALGVEVAAPVLGHRSAGTHSVSFDAGELPSGMYLYELRALGSRLTRTMLLAR